LRSFWPERAGAGLSPLIMMIILLDGKKMAIFKKIYQKHTE